MHILKVPDLRYVFAYMSLNVSYAKLFLILLLYQQI